MSDEPAGAMSPAEIISHLQSVPYLRGGRDSNGGDCWYVVEAWYLKRFGIVLDDRGAIGPGPDGLSEGFDNRSHWIEVVSPVDDDLVIMSAVVDRQRIIAGHVGVFWQGQVLHSEQHAGCVLQPVHSRRIAHRITRYLRYCPPR